MNDIIRPVNLDETDLSQFKVHLADCIILTHDHKLLMQQRPESWGQYAGVLNIFGGHVEENETVLKGLIREIREETGGIIRQEDLTFIGAITEAFTNYTELVHVYFWHDRHKTITGCYEAESVTYDRVEDALAHPKIMDYTVWALKEAQKKNLL